MKMYDNDENLIPELRKGERKYYLQVRHSIKIEVTLYINGGLVRVPHI